MAAPIEVAAPIAIEVEADALTTVEHALHLLDFAMPNSPFKARTIRSLALWLAEARYRERRSAAGLPPARRHLRSHLVK